MFYAIVVLIFLTVLVACWFAGTWSNLLTGINIALAGLVATSLYEPFCNFIESFDMQPMTYVLDFPIIWLMFFGAFAGFSLMSRLTSRYRVQFHPYMEMATRTISAGVVALMFLSFCLFTLHLAPLEPSPFGSFKASPGSTNLVIGPDRLWMGFARYTSRTSLAEFRNTPLAPLYEENESSTDAGRNRRVFDSAGDLEQRYAYRRGQLAEMPYLIEESFFPTEEDEQSY